jgi:polyisoprenoid-binding protein YceI
MRMIIFAAATLALALGAAAPQPALAQEAPAEAQRFVLDPEHTQVGFSIDRFGYNFVLGRFDTIAGEILLDQAHPERSSVSATIQTASLSAGNATRDEHLRSDRWLDAAQFPTMEFRSTSVTRTGENTADVVGDLTLHGVTHPVTLAVTLNKLGANPATRAPAAGFSATTVVSRAQFGITAAENLIGDDVRITIEALGAAAAE